MVMHLVEKKTSSEKVAEILLTSLFKSFIFLIKFKRNVFVKQNMKAVDYYSRNFEERVHAKLILFQFVGSFSEIREYPGL